MRIIKKILHITIISISLFSCKTNDKPKIEKIEEKIVKEEDVKKIEEKKEEKIVKEDIKKIEEKKEEKIVKKIEEKKENSIIRVKIKLKKNEDVIITNNKNIIVKDLSNNKNIKIKENKIVINIKNGALSINNTNVNSPIIINSKKDEMIELNSKYYLGSFKVIFNNNDFDIINYIPIETYLLSVLPSEMPVSFELEALKSQAVAARTYAYYFINKFGETREFDVDNTTSYQVYNGFNPNMKKEDKNKIALAVEKTKNLIIKYNNEPIIAYFHSNSGGKTINSKEYFGGKDYPYLISKKDPYSLGVKSSTWELIIQNKEFSKIFKYNGLITDKDITYNSDSYVDKMRIGTKQLDTKEIRRNVGYSVMKSERFSVKFNNDNIIFRGIGYGHGVGMSQWGANNMAKKGFNFKDIIEFYYPETKIDIF